MSPHRYPGQLSLDFDTCCDSEVPFEVGDHIVSDHTETLSLPALLAIALKPAPIDACRTLLEAHDSQLRRLAGVGNGDLRTLGITPKARGKLRAILEIAKRYGREEWQPGAAFRGSYDVYAHFREHLAEVTVEKFYVLLLDNKNRLLRLARNPSKTTSVRRGQAGR